MKRLLLSICLCLLLTSPAFAWGAMGVGQGVGAAAAPSYACSGCAACACGDAGADLACEDFDTDNSCSWTDDTDSGAAGTISHTASHNGTLSCTDKGEYALDILYDDDTAGDCFTYVNTGVSMGTAGTDYFVQFYINVIDLGAVDDAAFRQGYFFAGDSSTNPDTNSLRFVAFSTGIGAAEFRLYTASTLLVDTNTAITPGTWYRVVIRWKFVDGATNDQTEVYINGSSVGSSTNVEILEAPQYLFFGWGATTSTNYGLHFQIDNFKVDDDTIPTACPGS